MSGGDFRGIASPEQLNPRILACLSPKSWEMPYWGDRLAVLRPKIKFLANARPFFQAGVAQLVAQFVDNLAAVLAGVGRQHSEIPVFCSDNYIFLDRGLNLSFHLQIFAQSPPHSAPDLSALEPILLAP